MSLPVLSMLLGAVCLLVSAFARARESGAFESDDAAHLFARALSASVQGDDAGAMVLLRQAIELDPAEPRYGLVLAETLARTRRLPEAESVYRELLRRVPGFRSARLGLARVLLWQLKYRDSRLVFAALLRDSPGDTEAREGLALADYWSGDFRKAAREFRAILGNTPGNETARRSLSEIEAASKPAFEVLSEYISDDQPYRLFRGQAKASFSYDPLIRWDVSVGSYSLDSSGDGSARAPFAWLGTAITLPDCGLKILARVGVQRFADGSTSGLGGVSVVRIFENGRSTLVFEADRHELLWTASSVAGRASVTTYGARWTRETAAGFSASAGARALSYFDRNNGVTSDAYVLAPLTRGSGARLRLGVSVAYRDTDQDRFQFVGSSSRTLISGGFEYTYLGRYEPYWTPHDLLEGRLIAAARVGRDGGVVLDLHADGGCARDHAIALGPNTGVTATPPAPSPAFYRRTFRPWRASADVAVPLAASTLLRIGCEHRVTAFYRANEIRANLVGRF